MEKDALIYSFVARGTVVVAEYSEFTGNFPAIAAQCLQRLPSTNNKFTYTCDHHSFNFLVQDGYAYCVVTKESVSKQTSIAYLERIKTDFVKRYGGGRADTATAKSLNKEFGAVMKQQMNNILKESGDDDKMSKVKTEISNVKSVMLDNIDKAYGRGEQLTVLNDRTAELRNTAREFERTGNQVRRKMWYQNMKVKLLFVAVLISLALIIWLSICHGFKC